jgi:hypothetical protein
MNRIFRDSLEVDGVRGVMLYSVDGKLIYSDFNQALGSDPEKSVKWALFVNSLNGVQELELLFENSRLYIRKTVIGPLIVFLDLVSSSMVKLTAEILANNLEDSRIQRELKVYSV